jgi:NADPH-dependent 2,4-dienoyl-CoA reductase/sulfur reductase-like enzyme
MGPILINTKQKVAVLAAGLVVATTGFVTDQAAVAAPPAPVSTTHVRAHRPAAGTQRVRVVSGETSRQIGGNK